MWVLGLVAHKQIYKSRKIFGTFLAEIQILHLKFVSLASSIKCEVSFWNYFAKNTSNLENQVEHIQSQK